MSAATIISVLAGLALVPLLDPWSRRWLRAHARARRVKRLREDMREARRDDLDVRELELGIERLQLDARKREWTPPRSPSAVRTPPPGPSPIPPKPGPKPVARPD